MPSSDSSFAYWRAMASPCCWSLAFRCCCWASLPQSTCCPHQTAVDGPNFLVPGIVALAILSTSFVNTAISTGFDRHYGVLKRLGATPLRRSELTAAKILTVIVVEVVQVVALLLLGAAVGWDGPISPASLIAGIVLGTTAFVGLGLFMAGRLPGLLTLALANALYVVMLLVSGLVFPLEELPGAFATLSRGLPVTALATVLRGALGAAEADLGPWIVLVVWALAAPAAAVRWMQWHPSNR